MYDLHDDAMVDLGVCIVLCLLMCAMSVSFNRPEKIPIVRIIEEYTPGLGSGIAGPQQCSVCLDDLCAGDKCAQTHCGHTYHFTCLKDWARVNAVCPQCRAPLGSGLGPFTPQPRRTRRRTAAAFPPGEGNEDTGDNANSEFDENSNEGTDDDLEQRIVDLEQGNGHANHNAASSLEAASNVSLPPTEGRNIEMMSNVSRSSPQVPGESSSASSSSSTTAVSFETPVARVVGTISRLFDGIFQRSGRAVQVSPALSEGLERMEEGGVNSGGGGENDANPDTRLHDHASTGTSIPQTPQRRGSTKTTASSSSTTPESERATIPGSGNGSSSSSSSVSSDLHQHEEGCIIVPPETQEPGRQSREDDENVARRNMIYWTTPRVESDGSGMHDGDDDSDAENGEETRTGGRVAL